MAGSSYSHLSWQQLQEFTLKWLQPPTNPSGFLVPSVSGRTKCLCTSLKPRLFKSHCPSKSPLEVSEMWGCLLFFPWNPFRLNPNGSWLNSHNSVPSFLTLSLVLHTARKPLKHSLLCHI
jgi:hypothetical protein